MIAHVSLQDNFPDSCTYTSESWLSSPHSSGLYVFLHLDEDGVPFFAGRGRADAAWNRHGGYLWERFVREALGGSYRVVVVASSLDDAQSESILEACVSNYARSLLNTAAICRGRPVTERIDDPSRTSRLAEVYGEVDREQDPKLKLSLALEGQQLQYDLQRRVEIPESTRSVVNEMQSYTGINLFFIRPIIEGLMEAGRV